MRSLPEIVKAIEEMQGHLDPDVKESILASVRRVKEGEVAHPDGIDEAIALAYDVDDDWVLEAIARLLFVREAKECYVLAPVTTYNLLIIAAKYVRLVKMLQIGARDAMEDLFDDEALN